jgi:outer membrane immunogenic protein
MSAASSGLASATTALFIGGVAGVACGNNNTECHTQTVSGIAKIDELGSLRARVGFVPAPNLLIYGTGGLGFAHAKNDFTFTYSTQLGPNQPTVPSIVSTSAGGTSMLGWAAGAGIDWKWVTDAGSAFVFGVEYLHYDFGTQTVTVSNNAGASSAFHTSVSADTVKGRISYLFSIH